MGRQNQLGLPVAYMRGGTSKALFFHEKDIPEPGPCRDRLLKRVMGTPDPLQIDGMGGTKAVTSKIAIIKSSTREDADIDYTFAQVGTAEDKIDYHSNCGNISSAVGPFSIEEGLVKTFRPGVSIDPKLKAQEVRVYNTGTRKVLVSHVPIDEDGSVISSGNFTIAGVPGEAAPILMDYRDTVGASQNNGILPTQHTVDVVNIGGKDVEITICDVGNICVFANARDFGITGHESAATLTENSLWRTSCQELRGKAAQLLGWCKDWRKVDEVSPFGPLPIFVATPPKGLGHVSGRLFLDNMCHETMAGTGAICTAASSRTPGTIVHKIIGEQVAKEGILEIAHPTGIMPVFVQTEETVNLPKFRTLSFVRTARRILDGTVYVPAGFENGVGNERDVVASSPVKTNGISNGIIGKQNGVGIDQSKSVTETIAKFVYDTSSKALEDATRTSLKDLMLDYIGVSASGAINSESSPAVYEAALRLGNVSGTHTVFTKGQKFGAQQAALLNGTFSHSLDFDDTYLEGSLHAGATAITAGLLAAESSTVSNEIVLTAIAIGYEVTCRIGRALSSAAYERGFHNTATAGIFGAVATIAKIKNLPPHIIEMAFGLAGSKAAGSMQYLENGSWNKRLHPGFAVHDAWLCVILAESGVVGAAKILEGKHGFFNAYTPNTNIDWTALKAGLGTEWVFTRTTWKPFPACRMTHGLIEMADRLRAAAKPGLKMERIRIFLPPYMYNIVGTAVPNKIHPQNVVDAQFSAYYQVAIAWLYGGWTGWAAYDHLKDVEVHDLLDRVTCVRDESLLRYEQKLEIDFSDGTIATEKMLPTFGDEADPSSREKLIAKYFSLATPVYGGEKASRIMDIVFQFEKFKIADLMALVQ